MKIRRQLFHSLLPGVVGASAFIFAGCATESATKPTGRIVFSSTAINGKPARVVLDSGSNMTLLSASGARQSGVPVMPMANAQSNRGPLAISGPLRLTIGAETFTTQLPVVGGDGLPDVIIGWPEIQDNILVFDSDRLALRSVPEVPAETAGWLKLKVHADRLLILETSLPEGKTGLILIDTGALFGVAFPPARWEEWKAAHPHAPSSARSYGIPGILTWSRGGELWTDEIKLGALTLTDLPVSEYKALGSWKNLVGALGIYALKRVDLVVDGKNGFAYLHPKPPPGPPYPGFDRPAAGQESAREPVGGGDWTVADNVQLNRNRILAVSCVISGIAKERQGDFTGALADYDRGLAFDPQNADLYGVRGAVKEDKGDLDGAIADYARVLELDPQNAQANLKLSKATQKKAGAEVPAP